MEELEYIAQYLGLDISNKFILKDIAEIENKQQFILFMQENIKNTQLDFMNGLQKLSQLKKMLKKEINSERVEKAESEAYLLAKKFLHVNALLTDATSRGKVFKLEQLYQGEDRYFSSFEIKQLNDIGSIQYLLKLSTDGLLEKELNKKFMKLIHNQGNQIAYKNGKTLSLEIKRM